VEIVDILGAAFPPLCTD